MPPLGSQLTGPRLFGGFFEQQGGGSPFTTELSPELRGIADRLISGELLPNQVDQSDPVIQQVLGSIAFAPPGGATMTVGEIAAAQARIAGIPGLSATDRQALTAQLASPAGAFGINEAITTAENRTRALEEEARRQAAIDQSVSGLEDIRSRELGVFDERIGRLRGLLDDPNKLRSDAETAGQLQQAEDALNRQVGTIKRTSARRLSDAGLRASGKASAGIRQAEQAATAQLGNITSGILENASTRLEGLQGQRRTFDIASQSALDQARLGGTVDPTSLLGLATGPETSLFTPTGTNLDIQGLFRGASQQDFENLLNTFFGLASIGQNAGQQALQLPGAIKAGFGGG